LVQNVVVLEGDLEEAVVALVINLAIGEAIGMVDEVSVETVLNAPLVEGMVVTEADLEGDLEAVVVVGMEIGMVDEVVDSDRTESEEVTSSKHSASQSQSTGPFFTSQKQRHERCILADGPQWEKELFDTTVNFLCMMVIFYRSS